MSEFESIIAANYTQRETDDTLISEIWLASLLQTAELLSEIDPQ